MQKKIAGNAQAIKGGRLLYHSTLLFYSKLDTISAVLRVKADKIESKGIKSVRSRVANICEYYPAVTIDDFKQQFFKDLQAKKRLEQYEFNETEIHIIKTLRAEKYTTWEWNYGRSPVYDIKKERHFDGGNLSIYMNVEKGMIQTICIFWGYFGDGEISEIEEMLPSVPIREEDVKAVLQEFDIDHYIHGITMEELTGFIVY